MSPMEIILIIVAGLSIIAMLAVLISPKIFGTKVFKERRIAQSRMIADMVRSMELNYIGITHGQMIKFFDEAFSVKIEKRWETINFFFPTSEYGVCWDEDFNNKMSMSILNISNYLMNKHLAELGALKQVNFFLNTCGSNTGGSLFRYKNSRHPYDVIYDVMQIMSLDKKQDNAKTIRLNRWFDKQFFQRNKEMFDEIKTGAKLLYRIDLSKTDLWNQSASAWDDYEQENASPHTQSMRYMLNEMNLTNKTENLNILSLGSGTGKMEIQLIQNRRYKGFLGLVDKSYTMLYQAYERLKKDKNVSYSLIDLSEKDWPLYGEIAGRKYDYILMHFSLHNFTSQKQSLSDLAGRLKDMLAYNGKVIIAIHDHVYGSFDENELLRDKIRDFAIRNHIYRPDKSKKISLSNLKSDFYNNGLLVVKETEQVIERTIKERLTMWKVDAVLDSVLDVEALLRKNLKEALFTELAGIKVAHSKPMVVKYITFSEIIDVVSALIVNEDGEFLTTVKNGAFLLPGGEMMLGESEEETLRRELWEELEIGHTGIEIGERLGCFVFEKAFLENKPLHMNVYRCSLKQKTLTPKSEIDKYEWINLKKFTTYENMPKEYFLRILSAAGILLR